MFSGFRSVWIRLRSCRTRIRLETILIKDSEKKLTSYARKKLSSKALDLTIREGDKSIALQEIKDTLSEQVHDNAYVSTIVKAVPEVYAPISVLLVVCFES
jgi:hypothetical protein